MWNPPIFGYKNSGRPDNNSQNGSPRSVLGKKNQKRVNLLIHNFGSKGSDLAIDVSVANPFATSIKNPSPFFWQQRPGRSARSQVRE